MADTVHCKLDTATGKTTVKINNTLYHSVRTITVVEVDNDRLKDSQ